MKNYVSVHFSTKPDGFSDKLKAALINLAYTSEKGMVLVHAFASREFLESKNISTEVIDFLDRFFPNQVSFFNTQTSQPMRQMMFDYLKAKNGEPFFYGDFVGELSKDYPAGVKEEHELVEKMDMSINYDGLDFNECVKQVFFQ